MVFTVLGAVAELERSLIVEKVRAGLRHARSRGVKLGRAIARQERPLSRSAAIVSWAVRLEHAVERGKKPLHFRPTQLRIPVSELVVRQNQMFLPTDEIYSRGDMRARETLHSVSL
jgi:hypothetical protein